MYQKNTSVSFSVTVNVPDIYLRIYGISLQNICGMMCADRFLDLTDKPTGKILQLNLKLLGDGMVIVEKAGSLVKVPGDVQFAIDYARYLTYGSKFEIKDNDPLKAMKESHVFCLDVATTPYKGLPLAMQQMLCTDHARICSSTDSIEKEVEIKWRENTRSGHAYRLLECLEFLRNKLNYDVKQWSIPDNEIVAPVTETTAPAPASSSLFFKLESSPLKANVEEQQKPGHRL